MSDVRRRSPPGLALIHPWLLASYVVLALAATNLSEVGPTAGLRAWIVVLLAATLAWLLLRLLLRDAGKAAVLTSVAILLFFSYGHVYAYLDTHPLGGVLLGRHRFLAPLWILALVLAAWFARRARDLHSLNLALTLFGVVLLVFPLAQSIAVLLADRESSPSTTTVQSGACSLHLPSAAPAPDVYYIILDAYSRQDELLEVHGFDNSEFVGQLRAMGFYVADGSQSNYNWTKLSLASSLNLDYLEALGNLELSEDSDHILQTLIVKSRLARELKCLGYVTVGFETGFVWTEWKKADFFLTLRTRPFDRLSLTGGLSEFEGMLLRTSAVRLLADMGVLDQAYGLLVRFPQALTGDEFIARRARDRFVLQSLGKLRAIPSPKLVFVHLVLPHSPFIFNRDGEARADTVDDKDRNFLGMTGPLSKGYVDQLVFVNRQIVPALQQIVAISETPPIIVIQGDHGYSKRTPAERLAILNAYLLPGQAAQSLYPTITPVNTFRVILDSYFGGDFPLLPDASYWSPSAGGHDFTLVPNTWDGQG